MKKEVWFKGQKFIHVIDKKILYFHIIAPFYSAGKKYGWVGKTVGLGINEEALEYAKRNNCKIHVTVGVNTNTYEITPEAWMDFARKTGAVKLMGENKDTKIYVCQWSEANFLTIRGKLSYD